LPSINNFDYGISETVEGNTYIDSFVITSPPFHLAAKALRQKSSFLCHIQI